MEFVVFLRNKIKDLKKCTSNNLEKNIEENKNKETEDIRKANKDQVEVKGEIDITDELVKNEYREELENKPNKENIE